MKKIILILVMFALCFFNNIYAQADEQQYVFSTSDAVIEYDQEGTIYVSVSKNAGFASFILEVKYDTDFLELISSKKSTGADTVYNDGNLVINDDTPGRIKFVFASQENVTQDISLVDLTFKAIGVPENDGETLVEIDVTFLDDAEWSNDVLTDKITEENGNINIQLSEEAKNINIEQILINKEEESIKYQILLSGKTVSENVKVYIAEYAENKRFWGLQIRSFKEGTPITGDILYHDTMIVKCFVWNQSNIQPLTMCKEVSVR